MTTLKVIYQKLAEFILTRLAACISVVCLLLFFACMWLISSTPFEATTQFITEAARQYGFTSSRDQRLAYLVTLTAVVGLSVVIFALTRRRAFETGNQRFFPRFGMVTCVGVVIVGLFAYAILLPDRLWIFAAAILLGFFVMALIGPSWRTGTGAQFVAAILGAYLAVLIVPGLFVRPIPLMAADSASLSQFEMHILYLTMPGSAIAAGQNFFDQLPFSYGLLMPSLMSVIEHRFGELSIGDQLRIVQFAQIMFALSAAAAYLVYRPRAMIGILAALLIAGPYWASAGLGIWHPNQTGFRSLGLAVGMLVLMLAGQFKAEKTAWCLGAICGIAVLMNFETAIAIGGGFGIFLIMRSGRLPFGLYARMVGAIVAVIALYLVLYRLALGRLPFSGKEINFLDLIERFTSGGYGGRLFDAGYESSGYFIVPFALAMFGHAIYTIIEGFRKLGDGPIPLHAAQRVGVATTLIIWFSYYFNSPNWWQIWTHLFLYGFIIIDQFDDRLFGFGGGALSNWSYGERLRRMKITPQRLFLLFYLALLIPHTNRQLINFTADFMYPKWMSGTDKMSVVSGVLMPNVLAQALRRKADKLVALNIAASNRLVYLTFNVAFMPRLSGLFEASPYRNLFTELRGDRAFDIALEPILHRQTDVILIDASDGPLAVTGPREDFLNRVRQTLRHLYRNSGTEDGWEIWRPPTPLSSNESGMMSSYLSDHSETKE